MPMNGCAFVFLFTCVLLLLRRFYPAPKCQCSEENFFLFNFTWFCIGNFSNLFPVAVAGENSSFLWEINFIFLFFFSQLTHICTRMITITTLTNTQLHFFVFEKNSFLLSLHLSLIEFLLNFFFFKIISLSGLLVFLFSSSFIYGKFLDKNSTHTRFLYSLFFYFTQFSCFQIQSNFL